LAATPFERGKNEHVNSCINVEWDSNGPRIEVESNSIRSCGQGYYDENYKQRNVTIKACYVTVTIQNHTEIVAELH